MTDSLPPSPLNPGTLVIFGASGDLTRRKLVPSLYNLAKDGRLPDEFAVVGLATRSLDDEAFRDHVEEGLREHLNGVVDEETWQRLRERLLYLSGDFRDARTYAALKDRLGEAATRFGTGEGILFYLSTPPSFFADIVNLLGDQGLTQEERGWRRVVVEKPFGHDLDSARHLNRSLRETLREDQIFRIDHYLGKETVQNLMVLRFANGIFEPIWNRNYIDHVHITVAEEVGVGHRGKYYEEAGALRDMVPNHLFQLLSLVAMEPPSSFDAEAVRSRKRDALQAVRPMSPEAVLKSTVRGQYGPGTLASGGSVPGYRSGASVADDSPTETYAALKLFLDNWRWADVPFFLRTGKRLPKRLTEITIEFKCAPTSMFRETSAHRIAANRLQIRIQPREGITLRFGAKRPGPQLAVGNVDMDFSYADYFGEAPTTGYETLLHDAIKGDATLFQRADSIELGWDIVQPILDVWHALPPRDFPNYAAGSWGPPGADDLTATEGRTWKNE